MKIFFNLIIFCIFLNCKLFSVEFLGNFKQGSFILGKTDPNSKVYIDNRKVRVSNDGFFAFGLDRDRKTDVKIKIKKDGKSKIITKKVFKREYKIQRIDGLPPKQVTRHLKFMRELKKIIN